MFGSCVIPAGIADMTKLGYSLIAIATGERLMTFTAFPALYRLPDDGLAELTELGQVVPGHAPQFKVVESMLATAAPDMPCVIASEDLSFDGTQEIITRTYAPSPEGYRTALQAHVDDVARSKGYDSGVALATYINSTITLWAEEATAFVAWRDGVWAYALQEMQKVELGQRQPPSLQTLIGELTPIAWPE